MCVLPVCVYLPVCPQGACSALRGQKRTSDSLKLEL